MSRSPAILGLRLVGSLFPTLGLGLAGCAPPSDPSEALHWITTPALGFDLAVTEPDRALIPALLTWGSDGRNEVQSFFERPYPNGFVVRVFPDRASLVAYWHDVWRTVGLDEGCTVAAARAREVTLLSPAAWPQDGCGVSANGNRPAIILTHELVHVLHEQWNPRLGQVARAMPWFVEGLAVFASGQLRREYADRVRELVVSGQAPTRLTEIWEGTLRYGVAGSVVKHLDGVLGRAGLSLLLTATTEAEILAAARLSETDLMAGWRASVAALPR